MRTEMWISFISHVAEMSSRMDFSRWFIPLMWTYSAMPLGLTHLSVPDGLSPETRVTWQNKREDFVKEAIRKAGSGHLLVSEAIRKQHRSWVLGGNEEEQEEANGEQLTVYCDLYTLAFPIFIHSPNVFNHDMGAQMNYDWQ